MKKTISFIVLTCLVSWLAGGAIYLSGIRPGMPAYSFLGMAYMLIPAIVAVLLQKIVNKEGVEKPLLISFKFNRWFLIALFTPLLMTFLSLAVGLMFPGTGFSLTGEAIVEKYASSMPEEAIQAMLNQFNSIHPAVFLLLSIFQGLVAACTINGLFAFGEELGWRGYMLHHLRHWSCLKISVFTGMIWGIWHFPLILMGHNYPDHPVFGVFMMIVFCVLLSPVMTYIVIKSRSVITAALFHGSINAFAGFPMMYMTGGSDLSTGLVGYFGFIAITVVTLGFYLFDRYVTKENIFTLPAGNFLNN